MLAGKAFLVLASLFFYGWWNPANLWLILFSIIVNFAVGRRLTVKLTGTDGKTRRKLILLGGIAFNLGLLAYFKYADFVVGNLNGLMGSDLPLPHVVLPIAVSFFTFTRSPTSWIATVAKRRSTTCSVTSCSSRSSRI